MKTIILSSLLLISLSNLAAQPADSLIKQAYHKYPALFIAYQGFQGNTLGLSYGLTKECNYCDQRNLKSWSLGIELGLNIAQQRLIGTRFVAERGENFLGIRGTLLLLTSDFEKYGYILRPEIVLYPIKRKKLSLGVGYNFGSNFKKNNLLFGAVQVSVGYLFRRNR